MVYRLNLIFLEDWRIFLNNFNLDNKKPSPVSFRYDSEGNIIGGCWLSISEFYDELGTLFNGLTDISKRNRYMEQAWVKYTCLYDFLEKKLDDYFERKMIEIDWNKIGELFYNEYEMRKKHIYQLKEYKELYNAKCSVGLVINLINRLDR